MSKVYRSMQGKIIELDKLIMRNENTLAVGNVRVNARGDELGPGGIIIKRKEDIAADINVRNDTVPEAKRRESNPIVAQPIEEKPQPIEEKPTIRPIKSQKPADPMEG